MRQTTSQSRPTIEQQRAKHAWQAVERLKVGSEEADDYAREAKKLPVRIMTSGLGQALAFIKAKAGRKKEENGDAKNQEKNGFRALQQDLSDWARQRLQYPGPEQGLLEAVIHADSQFLRRATDEVLAYLRWLNRFTEAKGLPRKLEED